MDAHTIPTSLQGCTGSPKLCIMTWKRNNAVSNERKKENLHVCKCIEALKESTHTKLELVRGYIVFCMQSK